MSKSFHSSCEEIPPQRIIIVNQNKVSVNRSFFSYYLIITHIFNERHFILTEEIPHSLSKSRIDITGSKMKVYFQWNIYLNFSLV